MKKFFELSGVAITRRPDTYTHEIIIMEVEVEGRTLEVEALRSKKTPHGDFLPASVRVGGEKEFIWSFRQLKEIGFNGLAKLFRLEQNGQPAVGMIGLVSRDGKTVIAVIPLSEVGRVVVENTEDYGYICLGGRYQPHELIRLKSLLAYQQGLECQKTAAEQALLKSLFDLEEAEMKTEKARQEAARLARHKEILSRPQITVFTKAGKKVRGIPVTGDEWQVLADGQSAVLVESYDQETGQLGGPLEAFRVKKTPGGRAFMHEVKKGLSWESLKAQATAMVFKLFRLDGELATVPVVTSQQLEEMRQKLNSGTRVAVQEGDKFQIYTLEKGKSRPIGLFASL